MVTCSGYPARWWWAVCRVVLQPYQLRERLRKYLSLPDVHIVALDERLEGLIVPSKFVGVLAMGRPALWFAAADGEVGSLIKAPGCGVTVPTRDAAALTQTLRELSDNHASGGARLGTLAHQAQAVWSARFRRRGALAAWAVTIECCARQT